MLEEARADNREDDLEHMKPSCESSRFEVFDVCLLICPRQHEWKRTLKGGWGVFLILHLTYTLALLDTRRDGWIESVGLWCSYWTFLLILFTHTATTIFT